MCPLKYKTFSPGVLKVKVLLKVHYKTSGWADKAFYLSLSVGMGNIQICLKETFMVFGLLKVFDN